MNVGIDLGVVLIDTAEMYGNGRSEELIAEVISGRRERSISSARCCPQNASRRGTIAACEHSLKRLRTDYLDLYLLHWRGSIPLEETLEAFTALQRARLDPALRRQQFRRRRSRGSASAARRRRIATNQVLYNLEQRGIEWSLLPWCRKHGIPLMAYSPLGSDSRRLRTHPVLKAMAARLGATPARIALAWLLRQPDVVVIPKASSEAHVRDNHAALS